VKLPALPRLGIPLLAALLLHGLGLSLSHLQSKRQPPMVRLSARDDTADLLVLSRRLPEEQEMGTIPLPPRLSLPPPPPALLSALPPPPDATKRRPPAAGTTSPKKRALQVPAPRRLPGATRAVGSGTKSSPGTTTTRPPDPAVSAALATLESLREQAALPASAEEGTFADATGTKPPLLRPVGEAADSWRKLWEGARPESTPAEELGDLPASVELRKLPITQARGAGVIPSHGQAVVLADHLILLWIENGTLWMLRSPTRPG
jgi:hypothetical protein